MNRFNSAKSRLFEWFLSRLAGPEVAEAMLGDALEAGDQPDRNPELSLLELLRSLPPLFSTRIARFDVREVDRLMDKWPNSTRRAAAAIGLLACLPALLLVTGGILQMFFGTPAVLQWLERTIHNEQIPLVGFLRQPATVLGGLLLAGALNLLPLIRLGLSSREGSLIGTFSVRMRAGHLAIGSLAAALVVVLLGYGFTENYVVAPRPSAAQATIPVLVSDGKSEWRTDVRVYIPPPYDCPSDWTLVRVAWNEGDALERTTVRLLTLQSQDARCP